MKRIFTYILIALGIFFFLPSHYLGFLSSAPSAKGSIAETVIPTFTLTKPLIIECSPDERDHCGRYSWTEPNYITADNNHLIVATSGDRKVSPNGWRTDHKIHTIDINTGERLRIIDVPSRYPNQYFSNVELSGNFLLVDTNSKEYGATCLGFSAPFDQTSGEPTHVVPEDAEEWETELCLGINQVYVYNLKNGSLVNNVYCLDCSEDKVDIINDNVVMVSHNMEVDFYLKYVLSDHIGDQKLLFLNAPFSSVFKEIRLPSSGLLAKGYRVAGVETVKNKLLLDMVRYADTKETTPNATSALYVYDTKNYRKITTIKSDRSFNRIFSDGYKVIVDERSHRGYLPHGWHNPPEYKIYDLRSGKHISTLEYKEAKYKQTIGDSESGNYLKHELNESSVTLSGNYAFILSKVKEVSKRYVEVFDVTSGKKMGTIEPPNAHYHFGPIPGSALAASMKATDKKLIIEGYIKNSDIDKPKQLLFIYNLPEENNTKR